MDLFSIISLYLDSFWIYSITSISKLDHCIPLLTVIIISSSVNYSLHFIVNTFVEYSTSLDTY